MSDWKHSHVVPFSCRMAWAPIKKQDGLFDDVERQTPEGFG